MSARNEKARRAALKAAKQAGKLDPASGSGAVALDVEIPFTPYPHQRAAHALKMTARWLVLVWHRRAGKTVFCIVELILAAIACTRERPRFGYIAPFRYQAKGIAWEYLKAFTQVIPGIAVNESELTVTFPHNGAVIGIFGADHPDAFRGWYFDGVVLDEYGQIKPSLWGETLRPALSDRLGWAIFIGTPKGINAFSDVFFKAQKEGLAGGYAADLKRWNETNVLPPGEAEAARRDMSAAAFAQEYECDFFAAATNVLVSLEDCMKAIARDFSEDEYGYAGKVLGVDVARYGDDRSVIARRQGLVAFRMDDGPNGHIFRGLDTMALSAEVARIADGFDYDAIFVDGVGIGAGVVDRLRQLGYRTHDVQAGSTQGIPVRFQNKRAAMWWDMAEWVKVGSLPNDPVLLQELQAQTYTYANRAGKLELDQKDEIKERLQRSPDLADALALTFAMPVHRIQRAHVSGPGGRMQDLATEYDPYAS